MGRVTAKKKWPRILGMCQKVKHHLISITKSISKICIPNFVCVLTNERCKTYQTGFHSVDWVMTKGLDLGVLRGKKKSVCPTVMLSPPKPLDKIPPNLVCELLT